MSDFSYVDWQYKRWATRHLPNEESAAECLATHLVGRDAYLGIDPVQVCGRFYEHVSRQQQCPGLEPYRFGNNAYLGAGFMLPWSDNDYRTSMTKEPHA